MAVIISRQNWKVLDEVIEHISTKGWDSAALWIISEERKGVRRGQDHTRQTKGIQGPMLLFTLVVTFWWFGSLWYELTYGDGWFGVLETYMGTNDSGETVTFWFTTVVSVVFWSRIFSMLGGLTKQALTTAEDRRLAYRACEIWARGEGVVGLGDYCEFHLRFNHTPPFSEVMKKFSRI